MVNSPSNSADELAAQEVSQELAFHAYQLRSNLQNVTTAVTMITNNSFGDRSDFDMVNKLHPWIPMAAMRIKTPKVLLRTTDVEEFLRALLRTYGHLIDQEMLEKRTNDRIPVVSAIQQIEVCNSSAIKAADKLMELIVALEKARKTLRKRAARLTTEVNRLAEVEQRLRLDLEMITDEKAELKNENARLADELHSLRRQLSTLSQEKSLTAVDILHRVQQSHPTYVLDAIVAAIDDVSPLKALRELRGTLHTDFEFALASKALDASLLTAQQISDLAAALLALCDNSSLFDHANSDISDFFSDVVVEKARSYSRLVSVCRDPADVLDAHIIYPVRVFLAYSIGRYSAMSLLAAGKRLRNNPLIHAYYYYIKHGPSESEYPVELLISALYALMDSSENDPSALIQAYIDISANKNGGVTSSKLSDDEE